MKKLSNLEKTPRHPLFFFFALGALAILALSGCTAKFYRGIPVSLTTGSSYNPPTFSGSTFVDMNLQSSALSASTPVNRKISSVNVSQSIQTGEVATDGVNRKLSGGISYGY